MNMINILCVSMMAPLKRATSGGGQTFYHYISELAKQEDFRVDLIAKRLHGEEKEETVYNVNTQYVESRRDSLLHPICLVKDINAKFNPWSKTGNTLRWSLYDEIKSIIMKLEQEPDVVILEFTQMVFLAKFIKEQFPKAVIFASEHDVSFLRCERELNLEKNALKKLYKLIQYNTMKHEEVEALSYCDIIMPHNIKDAILLKEQGISPEKIQPLAAYFEKRNVEWKHSTKDIIFFGDMSRPENYESAIWFIDNVMRKIKSLSYRFVVIGNNPNTILLDRAIEFGDQIEVTGFVERIEPYFERCLCFVAPLQKGAGIKIKVLEALAMGVPVLTNEIGIEGIDIGKNIGYYHCESAHDYFDKIMQIDKDVHEAECVALQGKKTVEQYNFDIAVKKYCDKIRSLHGKYERDKNGKN